MRPKSRFFLLRELAFLLVIVGIAVLISYASGRTMVLTQPLSIILSPLQAVTDAWTGSVDRLRTLSELQIENAQLKQQITELEGQLLSRDEQVAENQRLHDLLKLPIPEEAKPITVSRVIGRNPDNWHQRLVLDKGTMAGIVADSVIADRKGLIGKVTATGPNVALVALLTDPSTSVGVLNTRTRSSGVVQGQGDRWPMLRYMEQPEKWRVGDRLVTSGLGGVYPKGLPVGRIVKLKSDVETYFPELRVEPSVGMDRLEEVVVLPPRLTAMPTPKPTPTPPPKPSPKPSAKPGGKQAVISRFWAPIILLPIALVWQISDLSILPVFGWRLDPTLVLVIAGGLMLGPRYGVAFGLVAGGCQDILLGAGLVYGLTKAIAGWGAGLIQPHIYRLDALSLGLVAMVWTLVEGLCVALYLLSHGRTAVWDHYAALALPLGLAHAFMLALLYTGLFRPPGPEAREA